MDCQEVKNIIPRYFQHTASEEEVKAVEEHLCVCHECRLALGELMDKMDEAVKPVEPQNPEEDIHVIPESGGESLEDAVESEKASNINKKDIAGPDEAAGKIGEEPAPAAEPEEAKTPEESKEPQEAPKEEPQPQEASNINDKDIAGPDKAEGEIGEQPAEAENKEDIEYIPGKNIEDISGEKEEAASGQDASIEEEIKPFFEEKGETPESAPAEDGSRVTGHGSREEESIRDLGAEASEGGIEEEQAEPSFQDKLEKEPVEDTTSDFPEKFSLEGESKVGLFEYISLAVGLGILGFFVYLLLKG